MMIGVGILLCELLGVYRAKKQHKSPEAVTDMVILCVIGGFLGAKLLYILV